MARTLLLLLLMFAVGGCASGGRQPAPAEPGCGDLGEGEQKLQLQVVRQTIGEGRLHAALAQLETLPAQALEVRYLKAEISRRLEREEAAALYRGLLGSCMEGYARHGLGLLAAAADDLQLAERELVAARRLLPVESRIRSDLGYVLLLDRQLEPARFEFQTALELDPDNRRAARNLLLLHLSQGDYQRAGALIQRFELEGAALAAVEDELVNLEDYWRQR